MNPIFGHLMETGFGGFYDGIVHLLITPADLLVVMGLSLLAGQQGPAGGRVLLAVLPIAWLLGGGFGQPFAVADSFDALLIVWFTIVGVMVALDRRWQLRWLRLIGLFSGLLFGFGSGASVGPQGPIAQELLGGVSTVAVITAIVSAQVAANSYRWLSIGCRVGGSWIAAAGLLTLGVHLKG